MLYVVRRTGWDLGFLGLFLRLVFRRSSQLQGLSRSSQGEGKKERRGRGTKKKSTLRVAARSLVSHTFQFLSIIPWSSISQVPTTNTAQACRPMDVE